MEVVVTVLKVAFMCRKKGLANSFSQTGTVNVGDLKTTELTQRLEASVNIEGDGDQS